MQQPEYQNQPAVINMQQQQPGQGTGPTVIMTSPIQPDTCPSLDGPTCRNLGIVQLSFGIATLVLDIISIIVFFVSWLQGIWAGITIIIPGALGMAAAKSKSRGLVVATGAMSITAAVFAFIAMGISVVMAILASYSGVGGLLLQAVIGLILLVEIGIAISHAVVCLRPACCAGPSVTHATTTTAYTMYPQGQPGYLQGQPGDPQSQPECPQGQPGYPQGQPECPQGQPGYTQGQPECPQGQPGYPQEQDNASYERLRI